MPFIILIGARKVYPSMLVFKCRSTSKLALALIFSTIICGFSASFILLAYYNYIYIGKSKPDMMFNVYKIDNPLPGSGVICYSSEHENHECLSDNGDDMLDHYNIGLGFRVSYFARYDRGKVKKIYISLMPPDLAI